jgi:hypothetical protein
MEQTKRLTVSFAMNGIPRITPTKGAIVEVRHTNDGFCIEGNRVGLRLMAKALIGVAECPRSDGYHFHIDDLYNEGQSNITIARLE